MLLSGLTVTGATVNGMVADESNPTVIVLASDTDLVRSDTTVVF